MRSLIGGRAWAFGAVIALANGGAACTGCGSRSGAPAIADGAGARVACVSSWPMPNAPASGLPRPQTYDTRASDAVLDVVTGLLWQRAMAPGRYDWVGAARYCGSLDLAGRHDWRVPSVLELVSIVDVTRADPAIDPAAFPATPSLPFWSSQTVTGNAGLAWYVFFKNGGAYAGNDVSDPQPVRCVSGGGPPSAGSGCYVISGPTVYDPQTKLTWPRAVDGRAHAWAEAQGYCTALDADGGGWRLPSLNELMTLVDLTRTDPAIDPQAFPGTPSEFFWSASPSVAPPGAAWGVNFNRGSAGASLVATPAYVRCVR